MGTYDVVHETFDTIVQDVGFQMGREQLHVFLLIMFNSSHWRVDIVLTKDGIYTLTNVVIVDPMWTNLLSWSCTIKRFIAFDVTQAKEMNFHNRHPIDQIFHLAIEVFGCLHKHAYVFLHDCANAIWSLKRSEGLYLFVLVTFFGQKISITLQRM
jgi:hypothetical protein